MRPAIVLMIVMLHAAFGCMFYFMDRQHPARFSRLMAWSWLLEAFRATIFLSQMDLPGGPTNHWHSLSDCLNLVATWCLLGGCADLAGVRLPARLGQLYLGLGIPLILLLRLFGPDALSAGAGVTPERANYFTVLTELTLIFGSVVLVRITILAWLVRTWRETRLPGAMLAIIFGVPYVVFAAAVPFQFYADYSPDWIYLMWAGRVLGFSLGLLMLQFDK